MSMFEGEFQALQAIETIFPGFTPTPLLLSRTSSAAMIVTKYYDLSTLECTKKDIQCELGRKLALMHQKTSENGQFGFPVSTFCGSTEQPNFWMDSWIDFWCERRLGLMKRLLSHDRVVVNQLEKLMDRCEDLFDGCDDIFPSLLHGDLCK